MHTAMRTTDYADVKTLQFPQMIYPSGWWSARIARKGEKIEGLRETYMTEKPFAMQYYNAEIHHAAFVLPTFLREARLRY